MSQKLKNLIIKPYQKLKVLNNTSKRFSPIATNYTAIYLFLIFIGAYLFLIRYYAQINLLFLSKEQIELTGQLLLFLATFVVIYISFFRIEELRKQIAENETFDRVSKGRR
jgi:hypothetical protein